MLRSRSALVLGLVGRGGLLVLCLLASVRFGAASVVTREVVTAFVDYGGSGGRPPDPLVLAVV
jgi:hypothetical protein